MVADIIPALHEAVMSGAFNKGRDGELVAAEMVADNLLPCWMQVSIENRA